MANPSIPRSGSAAQTAICRVVELGGTAKFTDIISVLNAEHQSIAVFHEKVVHALLSFGFAVIENGDALKATLVGKNYAGNYLVPAQLFLARYVGQIVPSRTARPFKALSSTVNVAPYRPGSDDHLRIPSLMGTTRKLPNGEIVE